MVTGGFKDIMIGDIRHTTTLREAELYDPQATQWSTTAHMNASRCEHSSVLLSNGAVLVVGGSRIEDVSVTPLDEAELFTYA